MSNVIATYFYQEPDNFDSTYANIKGDNKNKIYWNTVYLFFISSCMINKSVRHCLFTNVSRFLHREELEKLGVEIYDNIENSNLTKGKWASVKFFFDVVNYININPIFPNNKYYALFDTDCLAINPFNFDLLTDNNYAYISGKESDTNYNFHGKSLKSLSLYYKEINPSITIDIKNKIGGEFFCFKKVENNIILNQFNKILKSNINKELKTEEQILTMINASLPFSINENHIKRVWTTAKNFNLKRRDLSTFCFLHLPAEKNYLTNKILSNYQKNGYLIDNFQNKTLLNYPFILRIIKILKTMKQRFKI